MSNVERVRSATTTTAQTEKATTTTTTTTKAHRASASGEQQQQQQYNPKTATPGAATAATVKLQHQQLYHNQLYHQQQQRQQFSKSASHYKYNNSTSIAQQQQQHQQQQQQQPQYQLITTAVSGDFANASESDSSFFGGFFGSFFGLLLKVLFSPPGLVALVVAYSMLGACIFSLLEAPQDINTSAAIAKSREECLRELWIITEKLNVLYERNWSTLVHEQLRRFEDTIVAATRHTNNSSISGGGGGMFGGSTTALRRYGSAFDATTDADLMPTHWTFGEALLYSVTVITTIGHGSLTPRTPAGKIATILYALIGVPLMLMCLSSLGALLAEALQCTYARICCRLAKHQHHHNHHNHHNHHPPPRQHEKEHVEKQKHSPQNDLYQQQTHHLQVTGEKSGHLLEASAGMVADVSGGSGGKYARRCSADSLDDGALLKRRLSECLQQEKRHELDCKNCKYDALVTETNLSNGYDFNGSGNMAACGIDAVDDSCRLLHNSPAKFNQNEMSTTAKINAQYYHQQQQQQQKRPDVMLMATTTMTAMPTQKPMPQQYQQQYQQLYSRSATPSPQHFQQQPQQQQPPPPHSLQTFHIVSASSSPTHHGQQQQQQLPHSSLRSYASLQPHQQRSQQQQQQPQYVAVPSGALVRFQTTNAPTPVASALTGSANNCTTDGNGNVGIGVGATLIATGMPSNCYQAANVSMPGSTATATIYFPIATATHPQQQQQQQQQPAYATITTANSEATVATTTTTTTDSSNVAAATQLLCNQPIVKYHTIQLSHARKQHNQQHHPQHLLQEQATMMGGEVDVMPLPPPPAYQTATVHGIRRAKFLSKPLPPEIGTLVAGERDITCRHDLLLQQSDGAAAGNNCTNTATTPTATAAQSITAAQQPLTTSNAPNATSIAMLTAGLTATAAAAVTCSGNPPTTTAATTTQMGTLMSGNASSMVGSNATVDIMEDEEEHEQQRLGNCPHGTPSRVPLIGGSSNSTDHNNSNSPDNELRGARSLFNATAASFHRHTLNTFQRNATARKSVNFATARRAACNHHATSHRSGKASGGCYGDATTETSDDEEVAYMQRDGATAPGEQFPLNKLSSSKLKSKRSGCNHATDEREYCKATASADDADDEDNASTTADDDADANDATGPQVPITIVLLILICYICLGTVIFAFWENWSIVDGAYFCFVTLATIGYGDFMPERTFHGPHVQLFACCAYLLLGLVLVAMSFSILETQLMWKCKRIAVRLKLAND